MPTPAELGDDADYLEKLQARAAQLMAEADALEAEENNE